MPLFPTTPKEIAVPKWARESVWAARRNLALPDRVTDGMIYARLTECGKMTEADTDLMLISLGRDTAIIDATVQQDLALQKVWERGHNDGWKSLYHWKWCGASVSIDGCLMVPWCGMWLGIEKDGYVHS